MDQPVTIQCRGCAIVLSGRYDNNEVIHDEGCIFYKPESIIHTILIHSVSEISVTHDDPVEAQAIAERLFEDDISSKSEMFTVRVERVEIGSDD